MFHPAIVPYRVDFFNSLNREFDASFYFLYADAKEQSFRQDTLIERLDFTPEYLSPGFAGIRNLRLQVFSILKRKKPDVVFLSEFNLMGLPVLLYKLLFNRQLRIYTVCDDSRNIAAATSGLRSLLRSFLVKIYDGIILAGMDAVDWYRQRFKSVSKFLYFPIIQDDAACRSRLEEAIPAARELAAQYRLKGKNTILFVGRLIEIKNIPLLIEAFRRVHVQYPESVLIIVGEGELQEELKRQAVDLGVSDFVLFAGKKQGAELLAWYNVGQIFVLPSTVERFGAVVNEALLAGCYTLCSSAAGACTLIDAPDNGMTFDPSSPEELVWKLEKALYLRKTLSDKLQLKPDKMLKSYREYFSGLIRRMEN